ncbi:lipopolysaccharide biosynthesis protein [Priestia koreensis]|uniref:lipopolysaccharide biosynthesis protein n=1 Tax=Priestia koreensis TaxID=284581 RepID=UPI00301A5CD3
MDTKFIKIMSKLTSATLISQLVIILSMPILTRMFLPSDMGEYQSLITVTAILSTLASFKYERAITILEEEDSLVLTIGCIIIASIFSLIIFLISIIFMNVSLIDSLIISLTTLFMSIFQTLIFWVTKVNRIDKINISRIVKSLVTVLIHLLVGLLVINKNVLNIGYLGGYMLGSLMLISALYPFKNSISNFSVKNCYEILLKQTNYIKYSAPSALLNIASQSLPIIILTNFFGSAAVGYFSLGQRALTLPISIISQSISQQIYQKCADMIIKGESIKNFIENTCKYLFIVILGPSIVLLVKGPLIFRLIFGENWISAGYYCQILAPWLLLVFVVSPLTLIFNIFNKQDWVLKFEICLFLLRLVSLLLGCFTDNVIFALSAFSIVSSACFCWQLIVILKLSHVKFNLKALIKMIIPAIPMVCLFFIDNNLKGYQTITIILCLGVIYYLLCVANDSKVRRELMYVAKSTNKIRRQM